MKFLNISKDGIDNVVDEATYEAVYKPAGWKIVGENAFQPELAITPHDEIIKRNTNKMRKYQAQKFNDKLLKEDSNGEV